MAGACLNPYGCEWSIVYFWQSDDAAWPTGCDRTCQVLLAYTLAVVIHVSYRCHIARRGPDIDSASRRKLSAELSVEVQNLKSIAFTLPYLGLVGTCFGIMSAFRGVGMEKHAALAMISSLVAAALYHNRCGDSRGCCRQRVPPQLSAHVSRLGSGTKCRSGGCRYRNRFQKSRHSPRSQRQLSLFA